MNNAPSDHTAYKQALGDVLRHLKETPGEDLEWEWMADRPAGEGQYVARAPLQEWLISELNKSA